MTIEDCHREQVWCAADICQICGVKREGELGSRRELLRELIEEGVTGAEAFMHSADAAIAASGRGFRPMKAAPGFLRTAMFKLFVRPVASVEAAAVEHLVADGDELPIAGGLKAIHVPGHCAGQLAFHWPQHGGVLIAADACSNMMGLGLSLGYEDLELGRRSLRKLSALNFQVACFGHGKPILRDAAARFRALWP